VARAEDGWCVRVAGRVISVRGRLDGTVRVFEGEIGRRPFAAVLTRSPHCIGIRAAGRVLEVRVVPERAAAAARIMHKTVVDHQARAVVSPMPGLVIALSVAPGDEIRAGDEVAVVEAMKMENVLRAEFDGKVKAVLVAPGESIAVDQPLIDFE
jgi:propionyl-CoA carboxylase alpha chain